ncbi:MAG: hypothetical protein NTX28_03300 [Novosphingobium sp.]|nr:hypothetical protein [Novosphingobium sp.]
MDEIERDGFGEGLNGGCHSTTPVGEELGTPAKRRTSRVRRVDVVEESALDFVPFVHVAARRNSITPDKQRRFIATLAATGIVSQAALSIGASVEALYKLRHRAGAEDFARAWDAAVERGYSRLEDCALERAIAGEERPVVSRGEVVATWTHHNTGLLMFLLRARRPEKYGAVKLADLREGHPVYEALKVKWAAEREAADLARADTVRASLHARLLGMREEVLAARGLREAGEACDGVSTSLDTNGNGLDTNGNGLDTNGVPGSDAGDVDRGGRGEAQGVGDFDDVGHGAGLGGGEAFEAGEEGAAGLDEVGGGPFEL